MATHKMTGTKQYRSWKSMKDRCLNAKSKPYKNYGGRGIKIDNSWIDSFESFWHDMNDGYIHGYTLERIDVNGNYTKENCKWIPKIEQAKNRRTSNKITFNGVEMILQDWAKQLKITHAALIRRIKNWGLERALTESKRCKHYERTNTSI